MIERYRNDKATSIWSEKSKLDKWLQIEKEHVTTLYYNKEVTHYEYDQIIKNLPSEINEEHIEKWKMIEKSTRHDVAAFVDLLEDLGEIGFLVDVDDDKLRFSIKEQVDDLLDGLLEKIPTSERTDIKIKQINILINRFKQLREKTSIFDENLNVLEMKKINHPTEHLKK